MRLSNTDRHETTWDLITSTFSAEVWRHVYSSYFDLKVSIFSEAECFH